MLSYKNYVSKCVLGGEIVYALCLLGGLIPWRSVEGTELHHVLFETLPGFTWLTFGSIVWGAIIIGTVSIIFGLYMVWMHNSSIVR